MADLDITVGVNTRNARASLDRLQGQVRQTSDTFAKMRNAIAGLAIGNFVRQSFQMANSLNDLANATGIAVENVVGFSRAMAENGSTIDRARDGLTDFIKNVGEAANGSAELQRSFAAAGVSLDDLARLSEQDILRKTIEGLADVDDSASRSAAAMRIFGESFKGVDVGGLNNDLAASVEAARAQAAAIRSAGQASQNFKNALFELQLAVLDALQPLSEFVVSITENREAVTNAVGAIVDLGVAIAGLFVVNKLIALFKVLPTVLASITVGAGGAAAAFTGLFAATTRVAAGLTGLQFGALLGNLVLVRRSIGLLTVSLGAMGAAFVRAIPIIGQAVAIYYALSAAVDVLTGKDIGDWINSAADGLEAFVTEHAPAFADAINSIGDALGLEPGTAYRKELEAQGKIAKETTEEIDEQQRTQGQIRDVINSQAEASAKLIQNYRDTGEATIQNLRRQQELLGLGSEQAEMQRTLNGITDTYGEKLGELLNQYDELNKKPQENAAQLETVRNTINEITGAYQDQFVEAAGIARQIRDQKIELRQAAESAQTLAEATRAVREASNTSQEQIRDFEFRTSLINLTERQAQVQEEKYNLERNMLASIAPLQEQIIALKQEDTAHSREQIQVIQAAIDKIREQYNTSIPAIEEMVAKRREELRVQERSVALEEAKKSAAEAVASIQSRGAAAQREQVLEGLTGIQRELKQIELREKEVAIAAKERIRAQAESAGLNSEQIQAELAKIDKATRENIKMQKRFAQEAYDNSRTFSAGWSRAFQQYQDDATNSAKRAEEIFAQTTRGIEDMIVGFTKTGKFEWKDFVAEMTETLLRSELKVLIGNTFGGIGELLGLGGLSGGGGGAQRGESQTNPLFVQEVRGGGAVGGGSGGGSALGGLSGLLGGSDARTPGINSGASQGGGLMDTIGSITSGIGNLFGGSEPANSFSSNTPYSPNQSRRGSDLGSGGNFITDTVSKVGDFFGGFFADGGFLPQGKFGIAGENGPELITGPANVSPGMGGSNVTYNINAVDAASFKAMIARDPGFIHAVAQKGSQSVPRGR